MQNVESVNVITVALGVSGLLKGQWVLAKVGRWSVPEAVGKNIISSYICKINLIITYIKFKLNFSFLRYGSLYKNFMKGIKYRHIKLCSLCLKYLFIW